MNGVPLLADPSRPHLGPDVSPHLPEHVSVPFRVPPTQFGIEDLPRQVVWVQPLRVSLYERQLAQPFEDCCHLALIRVVAGSHDVAEHQEYVVMRAMEQTPNA